MLLRNVHKINIQNTFCNLSTITNLNIYNVNINFTNYLRTKLLYAIYLPNLSQNRNYSNNTTKNLKYITLFPEEKIVVYPSTLKILTNTFKLYGSLRNKFKIDDFIQGSKQVSLYFIVKVIEHAKLTVCYLINKIYIIYYLYL
jgi:hypothetical protein